MTHLTRRLGFARATVGLWFISIALPLNAAIGEAPVALLEAGDPHFVYEGRFDTSNPTGPAVIWQASRIRLDFESDSIALKFDDVKGQVFFNAEVDGHSQILALHETGESRNPVFSGLGAGSHHLVLFKRSEAAAGTARFRGVTLGPGGHALETARPNYRIRLQFFGDSITAGACNEDGATDQWDDRSTHNNALSYGAFTAAAFDADYRNIAVSGMGIAIGWTDVKANEMWDRLYPRKNSPKADLTSWTPDVVFVNLGENDDSFTTAKSLPFPSIDYTTGMIELVRSFRRAYPAAEIVILRGGMFGGAQSERLRIPWEEAVKTLENSDQRVSHFIFNHWAKLHPRVADHRAMADELIEWLKQQPFMRQQK